jgi:hypothetical protein
MGLNPQEMSEAITRNLKEKTGKSMDEWMEVLKNEHLEEKKAIVDFLKSEKGLGHFQAQVVFDSYKSMAQ